MNPPRSHKRLLPRDVREGIFDDRFYKRHMITAYQCKQCSKHFYLTQIDWLIKLYLVYKKVAGHTVSPALIATQIIDLILKFTFKYLASDLTDECLRRAALSHINPDVRKIVNGCRRRVRVEHAPLNPPIQLGGGEFGGGGAGSDWGDPSVLFDPIGDSEIPLPNFSLEKSVEQLAAEYENAVK